MSKYGIRKEKARQAAIDWQHWQSAQALSFGDLAEWQTHFARLARRYGLTKEFTENGIL